MRTFSKYIALKLGVLEHFRMMRSAMKYWNENKLFLKANPGFAPPPLNILFDILGKVSYRLYHEDGFHNAELVARWIRELLGENKYAKICDWGCGPERIIKHLPAMLADMKPQLYGIDYNRDTIKWCQRNISGVFFSANQLEPPLSFPENYFDFILARSVYTHLSERMHKLWLNELLRVTKPEGFILITTHGNNFRQDLQESEKNQYDQGKLVTVLDAKEGKRDFIAFHNPDYCRNVFLKDQEIVRHFSGDVWNGRTKQEVWIIRKPKFVSS